MLINFIYTNTASFHSLPTDVFLAVDQSECASSVTPSRLSDSAEHSIVVVMATSRVEGSVFTLHQIAYSKVNSLRGLVL